MISLPLILISLVSLLVFRHWRNFRRRRGLPLPQVPEVYPLLAISWTSARAINGYLSQVGEMSMGCDIPRNFREPFCILNSTKGAMELFEKRSSNYSDRPRLVMMDLSGWNWVIGFTPYSDRWRRLRKMFHQYFQQRAIPKHHEYISQASQTFLQDLLEAPEGFKSHAQNYSGAIILRLSYGYNAQAERDEYVAKLAEANPGNYLVDSIPILEYFPCMGFKNKSKEWMALAQTARVKPFEALKKAMVGSSPISSGTASTSLAFDNLQNLKDDIPMGEQEEIIRDCAGVAYVGNNIRLTITLILLAMRAMVNYPDAQDRAQEEIRRVVGTSRLPSFEDRKSLPYVDAIILETLRWGPITPLAIYHRSINDDVYEGYFIPGGSTVIGNTWYDGILHDKELYPDPYEFKPDASWDQTSRLAQLILAPLGLVDDAGVFQLSKATDATGAEIDVPFEFFDGPVTHPKPFKICITPHSPEVARVIKGA
ncbi:cytochrome P450 [Infundibulicybe gibba]|nr:cytochrome P450 [Infundibulicybe gibba]